MSTDSYKDTINKINNPSNDSNGDNEKMDLLCSALEQYSPGNNFNKLELELQVSKIDYNQIDDAKNKKVGNPQYSRKINFNANDIRNITKYILNAGYTRSKSNTFLRINSNERINSYDNNVQIRKSFRICIQEGGIPSFCKDNNSIYTGDNTNIHYENKFTEMKQTYNFTNYDNVRANLKKENDITKLVKTGLKSPGQTTQKEANFITNGKWQDIEKTFRYISRVSFTDNRNIDKSCARIDISTIYQSNGKEWKGIDEKKDKPIYEVEIEALNNYGCKKDNMKKSILFALKSVLCGVQDSCLPMKTAEIKKVNDAYSKISTDLADNIPWYNGPQPVTFQQEDMTIVCSPSRILEGGAKKPDKKKDKKKDKDKKSSPETNTGSYNITNKADGTRKLLFIFDDNTFFVDKLKQIQKTEIELKYVYNDEDNYNNTILDGELVTLRNGRMQYQVFDIYAYRNKSCLHMTFPKREKLFKEVVDFLQESVNISVICKEFQNVDRAGIEYIQGLNKSNSANVDSGFENDGMILTPTGSVSGYNNTDKVYKWKSVEQTTIDFKVKVIDTKTNVSQNGTEGHNTKQNICELQVSMKDKPIENACAIVYNKIPGEIKGSLDTSNSKSNEPVRFQVYNENGDINETGLASFPVVNTVMQTEENEDKKSQKFMDGDIVECEYRKSENGSGNWVAIRVRTDKTRPNAYDTAKSNYDFIQNPVPISGDLCERKKSDSVTTTNTNNKEAYYTNVGSRVVTSRNNFHNFVKKNLISETVDFLKGVNNLNLIDYGVGKGGDIFKWRDAKIKFAYGIDYSASNLQDDVNGACVRYIRMLMDKNITNKLECMFVQGDCSKSIENGDAFVESGSDKKYTDNKLTMANLINKSIFGQVIKDDIPRSMEGVIHIYEKGREGFHIGSSQFAMHYFFKSENTVQQFIDNLKYTIRVGGFFIGTCYNGKRVLDLLLNKPEFHYRTNNNISIKLNMAEGEGEEETGEYEEQKKRITDQFEKKIGGVSIIVQESGFKGQEEYLVNFDLFNEKMMNNGFRIKQAKTFQDVYNASNGKNQNSKGIMNDEEERVISFLNDQFIYEHVGNNMGGSSIPFETVPMPTDTSTT